MCSHLGLEEGVVHFKQMDVQKVAGGQIGIALLAGEAVLLPQPA